MDEHGFRANPDKIKAILAERKFKGLMAVVVGSEDLFQTLALLLLHMGSDACSTPVLLQAGIHLYRPTPLHVQLSQLTLTPPAVHEIP